MNQELYDRIREVQQASLFRVDQGSGFARVVDTPFLGGSIASAFERVARFADPAIEVARLGVHEVHFAAFAFDAVEDGLNRIDEMKNWHIDGSINVRRMAAGRC